MKPVFEEDYFKSNNYKDYLSKGERYFRTAEELYFTLNKVGILNHHTKILDYGCSVGFLIQGLQRIGCKDVYGYDISDWAIDLARKSGCNIIDKPEGTYDLVIFLDVLEHMTDEQIYDAFNKIKMGKVLVRIPVAIESNPNQFHLDVSRRDPTHINCKTDVQWIKFFQKLGYQNHLRLNFHTIYDSDGCFCCIFI
jgi:SAM-dependent methyltransferase